MPCSTAENPSDAESRGPSMPGPVFFSADFFGRLANGRMGSAVSGRSSWLQLQPISPDHKAIASTR
jgi:hypothetical protein